MRTVLSTTNITQRQRIRYWRDGVCDAFVNLDCKPYSEQAFFGELTAAQCGSLNFSNVTSNGQIVRRTASRIRCAREEIMLISIQVRGVCIVAQDGREAKLEPGDLACYDSTRPYTLNCAADFEQVVLHLPRDAMVQRVGRTEHWTARRVEATTPVGSLVLPFVSRTAEIIEEVTPATAIRLSETSLSLITAALGERFGEATAGGSSARTALIFRAKAIIENHLHEPSLNTYMVAMLLRISPRYLQTLFRSEGTTVSDCIWTRRLEKARRDLSDPLRASDNIAQIAFSCGFVDLTHFGRRYKEAFGTSPREDRARLLNEARDAIRR